MTYLQRKVPKSGEIFGNFILSAIIWREPQGYGNVNITWEGIYSVLMTIEQ